VIYLLILSDLAKDSISGPLQPGQTFCSLQDAGLSHLGVTTGQSSSISHWKKGSFLLHSTLTGRLQVLVNSPHLVFELHLKLRFASLTGDEQE